MVRLLFKRLQQVCMGPKYFFGIIFLAAVVGTLSGILGQLVVSTYLLPLSVQSNTTDSLATVLAPTFERIRRSANDQLMPLVGPIVERVLPGLALVSNAAPLRGNTLANLADVADYPGAIISNDGWIAWYQQQGTAQARSVILDGRTIALGEQIVDPLTNIHFAKASKENLPVITLDTDRPIIGDTVLIVRPTYAAFGLVAHNRYLVNPAQPQTSDAFSDRILVSGIDASKENIGALVFNLDGSAIGIIEQQLISGEHIVIPMARIRSSILDVLRAGSVSRLRAGITYRDLSRTVGSATSTPTQRLGAQVLTVARQSAAARAGLRSNDIITHVDGQMVDAATTLVDSLQQYDPLDTVALTVLRQQETLELTMTLQEY